MAPGTYGKTWWRNGYACGCMIQSIEDIIEPRLREAGYLSSSGQVSVFQYCYSGSVSASAGTHDGGGAMDHQKGSDGETKIWRECGVADYQRGSPQDYAFDDHNHGIWQGCPHLSSGAANQVVDYKNGRNGLADGGPDQSPNVAPITWQDAYDKYKAPEPKGILDMTEFIWGHASDDQTTNPDDEWHALKINADDGYTAAIGPRDTITVTANVLLAGLPEGASFDVCWGELDFKDGQDGKNFSFRGPRGASVNRGNIEAVYNGYLKKLSDGWTRRLRLYYRTKTKGVTVRSVVIEGWRDDD